LGALAGKLTPELCGEFMWVFREGGIEHYKHIVTRRYLRLDRDGRCLILAASGTTEVPFDREWKRVTGRAGGSDNGDGN